MLHSVALSRLSNRLLITTIQEMSRRQLFRAQYTGRRDDQQSCPEGEVELFAFPSTMRIVNMETILRSVANQTSLPETEKVLISASKLSMKVEIL